MVTPLIGAYQPVDFQSPVTTLWIVAVLMVVAAAAYGHATWRRRKHLRHAEQTGRHPDPNLLRDTRIERVVAAVLVVPALVLAGFSAVGAWQTHQNVRSNLAEKYGVTSVDNDHWTGAYLVADLTQEDGTVLTEQKVYFEQDGEPLTGDDIFLELPGGA